MTSVNLLTKFLMILTLFAQVPAHAQKCEQLFTIGATAVAKGKESKSAELAALTYLQKYGLYIALDGLTQMSGEQVISSIRPSVSQSLSANEKLAITKAVDDLRMGLINFKEFQRRLYFGSDAAARARIPNATNQELSSLNKMSLSPNHWPGPVLADILGQLPERLKLTGLDFGSVGTLPGLFTVGIIDTKLSRNPSAEHAKQSTEPMVTIVLWTAGDVDVGNSASLDLKGPRLVLTGIRNNDKTVTVKTVEAKVYDSITKSWEPLLYEFRDGKLEKVFETSDKSHSINRCIACHGFARNYSPIPFKHDPHYEPAVGFLSGTQLGRGNIPSSLGVWLFKRDVSPNGYNAIRKTIHTPTPGKMSGFQANDLNSRLDNQELVYVAYPGQDNVTATLWQTTWHYATRPSRYGTTHLEAGEFDRQIEILKTGMETTHKSSNQVADIGVVFAVVPGGATIAEYYGQSAGQPRALSNAIDALEERLKGVNYTAIRRIHWRHEIGDQSPIVYTADEMMAENKIQARFANVMPPGRELDLNYPKSPYYSSTVIFQNSKGDVVGVSAFSPSSGG